MDRIVQRGFLIAGVNQNAYRVGYRDPASGALVGFDIDIVHAIARALFGDPDRVRFAAIDAANRVSVVDHQHPPVAHYVDLEAKTGIWPVVFRCGHVVDE